MQKIPEAPYRKWGGRMREKKEPSCEKEIFALTSTELYWLKEHLDWCNV